ncbi:hypothetical protein [Paenibacillus sp. HB172176]|uniref:hypothetical protein n=1 Tax=Paenibacillus sp. HB172176 TaxID=2493690 RepID=UPI00143B6F88|nr:hypothetical protein [Paenibacillus sp. HB172176]
MIKARADKDLKIQFGLSMFNILIVAWNVYFILLHDSPLFLLYFFAPAVAIILYLDTMIVLDLMKHDYLTMQARLIKKGYRKITVEDSEGKTRKLGIRDNFVREFKGGERLEIQFYRRTKMVISISKIYKDLGDRYE